jgi:hypothetical protein
MRCVVLLPLVFLSAMAVPLSAGLRTGPQIADGLALPVVADLNGDGLTDIVQDESVLLNSGGGHFVKRELGLEGEVAIEALDVNGDGRVDLLARATGMGSVGPGLRPHSVYMAAGNLQFARFDVENSGGYQPFVAEVNGDAKDDLVLIRNVSEERLTGTEVKVLVSNGDGTFAARNTFRIPKSPQLVMTNRIPAGDVDRDGHRDLVIRTANELNVVRGIGNGEFAPVETRYLPTNPFGGWETELADVDNDGNLDVLVAGQRTVRAFLGDGDGRFTRFASVKIARLHDPMYPTGTWIGGPPGRPELTADRTSQPRNFAFGSFVQQGRTEIAAGTGEGDVVVLAWERNGLREVDRIETEMLAADVHAGSFLAAGSNDLYVTWNFGYPKARPVPRLLLAEPAEPAPLVRTTSRRRAATARPSSLSFDVAMTHTCMSTLAESWQLAWEGAFGVERRPDRTVEVVLDGDVMAVRLEVQGAETLFPILTYKDGRYEGTHDIDTPCGRQSVTITATAN